MMLWSMNSGWHLVMGWLLAVAQRMAAQAERNETLAEEQREMLRQEAAVLEAKAERLRTMGRALEDLEDGALGRARAAASAADSVCDAAQTEAWAILGVRPTVLQQAGKSREAVMGGLLNSIKRTGRDRTVSFARNTARELRLLPGFPERDGLADRLDRAAGALATAAEDVDRIAGQVEADHRAPLGGFLAELRVEAVRLQGRLLAKFPREFVTTAFPGSRRASHATPGAAEPIAAVTPAVVNPILPSNP